MEDRYMIIDETGKVCVSDIPLEKALQVLKALLKKYPRKQFTISIMSNKYYE